MFRSYADLMAWSSTSLPAQRSVLWGMNEAELTPGLDDSRGVVGACSDAAHRSSELVGVDRADERA